MSDGKHSKSFEIALSGISCAVAVAFLSLGILSGFFVATGYLVGVVALMAPLSKQFFKGGFLAYIGTCILTIIMGVAARFWDLVPFIMFFGLHPLINALQTRYKINKWLALAVKTVWFDCTLIAAYYLVFDGVLGGRYLSQEIIELLNKYIFAVIFILGSALFFFYDNAVFRTQILVNRIVYRIKK